MPAPSTRSLPAITLLLASSLTVMAGALVAPAMPKIANHFAGLPDVEIKSRLLLTLPALGVVLAGGLAGFLTDRLGRLRVLLGALIIYAIGGASGLLLDSMSALLVGRFVLGVGVAGVMTAATTLIADLWPGPDRARFLGFQAAFMGLGGLFFLVGGGALADLHWRAPFAIYLLAALLTVPAWLAFRAVQGPAPGHGGPGVAEGPPASVWAVWAAGLVGFMLYYAIPTQLPFSLKERLGASGLQVGLVVGTSTLTSAVFSLLCRRVVNRLGREGTLMAAFTGMAAGFALLAPALGWAGVFVAVAIIGGGAGLLMPNLTGWLVAGTAPERRGRVLGGLTMASFAGMFISPLLTQPMRVRVGLHGGRGAFAAAAGVALAGALVTAVGRMRARRRVSA